MIPLGFKAPMFDLLEPLTGSNRKLYELQGKKGTLIMFICNHCPFVVHIKEELIKLGKEYQKKGISFVAINSNDVNKYPDDHPNKMIEEGYPFPYLFDESQEVAKAYDAACTPDFYLFDPFARCVYRGQLDESRPESGIPVSGKDLRLAMNALIGGKKIAGKQNPSLGCNIKWKKN
jgi:thiol-disulfide isomerase/thioredoxin